MTTSVQLIEESVRAAGQEHFADQPALANAAAFGALLARAGMAFDWIELAQAAIEDGDEAATRMALARAKSVLLGEHAQPRAAPAEAAE